MCAHSLRSSVHRCAFVPCMHFNSEIFSRVESTLDMYTDAGML